MLGLFIWQPALALAPAALFLVLHRRTRRRGVLIVALAWLSYGLYEQGMKSRLLCSGECNIRVDLLLIYPVLAVASLAALLGAARRRPSE